MSGGSEARPASDRERAFDALALTAVWEHDITGSGLDNASLHREITTRWFYKLPLSTTNLNTRGLE